MKKTYILALAALAMAFSCQKAENSSEATSEPVVRTFTCTFAQPDTKLAIDDTDGKTTWEVGDQILVHGEGSSNRQIITLDTGDISADGKTATITVTSVTAYDRSDKGYISTYYASYPASAVPSGNQYYYARFNDTNLPLMAAYDKGDSFVFTNICGVLSFKVSGDFDTYVFSGNNNETIGYTIFQARVVNKTGNVEQLEIPYSGDGLPSGPQKSITGDVYDDGTTINSIYFPNGANFTGGFTIKFLKSGSVVKTLSTTKSVNVPRNSYRPMGDVTAYLVAYTTHDSSITPVPADEADLSKDASANCYVVNASVPGNAGKIFKFKAVKGNSSNVLSSIKSAGIIWETYNNAETVTAKSVIAGVDYDLQAGGDPYIVFQMPETPHAGNALIAAYDGPYDGDGKPTGNILWSWHIWVPDPSSAITFVDEPLYSSKKTMSRNLGALVDADSADPAPVSSYGLLYEWGRKDPFLGSVTVAGTAISSQTTRMTIEESIQHPTVYVNVSGKAWTPSATATTADGSLWGETTKTIYDPCPVGYMLPQRASTDFWGGSEQKSSANLTVSTENNRFAYGNLVFPFAGYIDDGSDGYKKATLRTILWSGRWDSGTEKGYGFYAYLDSDGPSYTRSSISRCRGGSVRCVAE